MKKLKWAIALIVLLVAIAVPSLTAFSQETPHSSNRTQLYWYGQSAFKLTTPSGKVLLIDSWLQNPLNPNGKQDLDKLDRVDLILVTHGHSDHVGSLSALLTLLREYWV